MIRNEISLLLIKERGSVPAPPSKNEYKHSMIKLEISGSYQVYIMRTEPLALFRYLYLGPMASQTYEFLHRPSTAPHDKTYQIASRSELRGVRTITFKTRKLRVNFFVLSFRLDGPTAYRYAPFELKFCMDIRSDLYWCLL